MRMYIAALALAASSSPAAAADWWQATTDHFIVYSETSREEAEKLAVDLERFDEVMRYMRGIADQSVEVPESAKLTVYQFGDTDDIGRLAGSRGIAGFFIPRAGDSVAFVPAREPREDGIGTRTGGEEDFAGTVLFHEYAHYFMYQNAPAAYPLWYSEGFAEVYGTVELIECGFRIGGAATHRADVLRYLNTYHVERLLDPPKDMSGIDMAQVYALGWLLANYLSFSGERPGQLEEYLKLVNEGSSSLDAAKQAFGDLDKLNRDLDEFRRGRAHIVEVKYADCDSPTAEVRALTDAEEAMMPLHIQSTRGVDEEEAERLVDDARQLAATYPDSVPALLAAVEAEYDAENLAAAEKLAERVLQLDESNTDAHIYLARIAMRRAKEDPAQFMVARRQFAAANRSDPQNPVPLMGYYLSFQLAGETPPEDALIALEQAYRYAPFDTEIRTTLAHLLLTEDRDEEALVLLAPIINAPHPDPGERLKKLRELSDQIARGDKTEALEELAPSLEEEGEEEEDA